MFGVVLFLVVLHTPLVVTREPLTVEIKFFQIHHQRPFDRYSENFKILAIFLTLLDGCILQKICQKSLKKPDFLQTGFQVHRIMNLMKLNCDKLYQNEKITQQIRFWNRQISLNFACNLIKNPSYMIKKLCDVDLVKIIS